MAYPSQGERVERDFRIPVELAEWLAAEARPRGMDAVCPAGRSQNDLVVQALYVLRELRSGIPSPHSVRILDEALADLDRMAAG